jgi:hypothetical protein
MNKTLQLKFGIAAALISVSTIISIGGLYLSTLLILFCFFGWVGVKLYEIKVNTWLGLLLFIIPLNLMLNPLYLLMLLKSWTMLQYKDQLEELERKQQKT